MEQRITSPDRILRILQRICQAGLSVLVRYSAKDAIAIKGRATRVVSDGHRSNMRISDVSQRGMQVLTDKTAITVEFIMMSTKVVFMANIVEREGQALFVSLPKELVMVERRKTARQQLNDEWRAFLSFNLWTPDCSDLLSPPAFIHSDGLQKCLTIADISMGGLCGVTRFPSAIKVLQSGIIDDNAKLHFPMSTPVPVRMEVRWCKRIKEDLSDANSKIRQVRSYRFGIEFGEMSERAVTLLRQYMQQLSQAEAV